MLTLYFHWVTRFWWLVTDTNSCGNGPHCYQPRGYNFPSGFGGDITEVTLLAGFFVLYRRHNCQVSGCWRLAWHPSEAHGGHIVCRKHHPHTSDPTHPINGGKP